jgi:hypothetical protein
VHLRIGRSGGEPIARRVLLADVVPECFVDPENAGSRRAAANLQHGADTYNLTHDGGCVKQMCLVELRMGLVTGLRRLAVAGVEKENGGASW